MSDLCLLSDMDDEGESLQMTQSDVSPLETSSVPECALAIEGPITRLPVELLSEIFCIVRDKVFPTSWDSMLLVCTHWRAVALANPQLWRCISNAESSATVKRDLLYCRDLPLEVVIFSDHSDLSSFLKILEPHCHRVETLEAFLLHRKDLSTLSTVSFPSVKYISFAAAYRNLYKLAFPCSLFPSAEAIQLMDVDIALHSECVILDKLTMLSIANNGGTPLPGLANILSVLQAAPRLRILRLQGTWPVPTENIKFLRGKSSTRMRHLKTAIFRTEPAFTREFLSVVSFPGTSRVLLQLSLPADELHVPTKAGRNLFSNALPDGVYFHNRGLLADIKGLFVTLENVAGFSLIPGPLAFEVDAGSTPSVTSPFWRDVVCAFGDALRHGRLGINQHCAVLSLRGNADHTLDLLSLLLALPALEFVEIDGRYVLAMLDALAGVNLFSEGDDVMVCPALKRLQIRNLIVNDEVVTKIAECFRAQRV